MAHILRFSPLTRALKYPYRGNQLPHVLESESVKTTHVYDHYNVII